MKDDFRKRKLWIIFFLAAGIVFAWKTHRNYAHKFLSLPKELKEISGMEFDKDGNLWTINDGGNSTEIHQLDSLGKIKKSINIYNAKNIDWEDLTQDDFGHFFIGDFGNNKNERTSLTIYRIENPIDIWSKEAEGGIIRFKFDNQEIEKNNKGLHNFDLEAFVFYEGRLYLFTKNRTKPFDGYTNLYRMEDYASNQKAELVSRFSTCLAGKYQCWITGAAMSPDRTKLALLGSNKIWVFKNWESDDFFSGDLQEIDLGLITQKEAITFENDSTVIIADEEYMGIGGNLYRHHID